MSTDSATLGAFLGADLYERGGKPRTKGYTSVGDLNAPKAVVEAYLEAFSPHIDIVKFSTGRLFQTVEEIREITELCARHGVLVQPSGTYLEIARLRGQGEQTLHRLREAGFTQVEVSASTSRVHDMDEQTEFAQLAIELGLEVVGEVGKKWAEGDTTRLATDEVNVPETIKHMRAYLDAGVKKIYWEGQLLKLVIGQTPEEVQQRRESALAQISPVVEEIGAEHIIFETSALLPGRTRRLMCLWFVRHFGPEVGLGNLQFQDVAMVECIRRGIAPIKGLGRAGDHPWIRALDEGDGTPRENWWEDSG